MSAHDPDGGATQTFEWRGVSRVETRSGLPRKAGRALDVTSMVGKRFGELVVLSAARRPDGDRKQHVMVRCDCGVERPYPASQLLRGRTKTCNTREHRDASAVVAGESLLGQVFGLLTVVSALAERVSEGAKRGRQVLTRCACGAERRVFITDLRGGSVVTCGGDAHAAVRPQAKRWEVAGKKTTYALEAVGTGRIKIGVARNIEERMRDLQTACPVTLRLIASCNDNIEMRLHSELLEHCVHGEWFVANDEVLAKIGAEMTPRDVTVDVGRCRFGKKGKAKGTRHRCKACGELGHQARTCGRQFTKQ